MRLGLLCFLFCIAMSSSIDVVLKLASFSMNPFQMAFWRFLCGGLFCLPVAVRTMRRMKLGFSVDVLASFLCSGLICVALSTGCYQLAIAMGKASVVSVLYCCNPLFVVVADRWMLKERITPDVILSSVLYLAGMLVILVSQSERTSMISCVFTLLASAFFAVYNVLGQKWIQRFPPVMYVTFSFLFGAVELLLLIIISHTAGWSVWAGRHGLSALADIPLTSQISGQMVLVLLYIGIVATGLNYLALQIATRELSAITASLIFYFKLILSPFLAWTVLGESIHQSLKAAVVLILLALLVKPLSARLGRVGGGRGSPHGKQ